VGILATLIRAATPENPRFSLTDPAAWDAFADGPPSGTGVAITRETALTFSPWWRGVTLLSRDVGKLPLYIYRRNGDGKDRAADHPAYRLLLRKPNEAQTALEFRSQLTAHALSGGNGYAYITRENGVDPTELLPLDPDCTYPVRADGVLHYVTEAGGVQRKLFAADVLHIKGFSWDGLSGVSVVKKAKDVLGLGLGALKSQAVSLKNGSRPGVVLETPNALDDKTKTNLRESWERMHTGIG
jgi:HK97 family phage portal protein